MYKIMIIDDNHISVDGISLEDGGYKVIRQAAQ